jgi:hypothetical protein
MKIVCLLENRSCALGKAPTCDVTAVESVGGVRCNKFLSNPCQKFGYALLEIQPSASVRVEGAIDAVASKFCCWHSLTGCEGRQGALSSLDYEPRPPVHLDTVSPTHFVE